LLMGTLSSAKTLGGVGGILVFVPGISLVGWILILLATKEISETVQDKTIFDDALLAGITAVIGAVIGAVLFVGFLFSPRPSVGFFPFWQPCIISAILSHPWRVLGLHNHLRRLSQAFIRKDFTTTKRQRLRYCRFALPDRSSTHNRTGRLSDTSHSVGLPGRSVLLNSRPASNA